MEKDYSHLEGKEISYQVNGKEEYKGIIALIDPDIGITIVDKDDHENYLSCLVLPSSPKWDASLDKEEVKKEFYEIVEMLEKGFYNVEPTTYQTFFGSDPTADDCAFI